MTFEQMFRDYMLTREQVHLELFEHGFITYKQEDADTIYAIDLYCTPDQRHNGKTLEFYNKFEQSIKQRGFKNLITSVAFFDDNSTTMLGYMLKSGYKLFSSDGNLLYVRKEL